MGRGIEFYKSTFLTFLVMGFGTILIVGLISGFAGRTPDCSKTTDKPAQPSTTSAVPTTKPTIGTNATSPTTRTSPTTSSSSPSTSSPSTSSTSSSSSTQSLPLIKHNAVLSSLANLSPRSRGILPGTKVDVTALETAV